MNPESYTREDYEKTYQIFQERFPELKKLLYPRRIVPRQGYTNPKFTALTLAVQLGMKLNSAEYAKRCDEQPAIKGRIVAWNLIEASYPIYFVAPELATAIAETLPPEDMLLKDVVWAMDNFIVMIPLEFSLKYFGCEVQFIVVSNYVAGDRHIPRCLEDMELDTRPINAAYDVEAKKGIAVLVEAWVNGSLVEYVSTHGDTNSLGKLMNWADLKTLTEKSLKSDNDEIGPPTDTDVMLLNKTMAFTLGLLLAMNAVPELITKERIERPARIKHNREVEALWQPNIIGENFRVVREYPDREPESESTGIKKRMHWRKGHWRHQPVGQRELKQRKLIWLKPVLINPPQKEE